MHGSQRHVFTNEFDDLSIVISIDMGDASARMLVTISEPNCVWDELVPTTVELVAPSPKGKRRDIPGTMDSSRERLEQRIEWALGSNPSPDHPEAA